MLRIITLNLNGIRSAFAKGFPRWLARQRAEALHRRAGVGRPGQAHRCSSVDMKYQASMNE